MGWCVISGPRIGIRYQQLLPTAWSPGGVGVRLPPSWPAGPSPTPAPHLLCRRARLLTKYEQQILRSPLASSSHLTNRESFDSFGTSRLGSGSMTARLQMRHAQSRSFMEFEISRCAVGAGASSMRLSRPLPLFVVPMCSNVRARSSTIFWH